MNIEKILDNVLYIMLILSGLLCLAASGRDLAGVIIGVAKGDYWFALFFALWAICLFAVGFRNIKAAWRYLRTKFGF